LGSTRKSAANGQGIETMSTQKPIPIADRDQQERARAAAIGCSAVGLMLTLSAYSGASR
jgi:hypothetical protein